ncbi:hypothetical protein [Stackebrandtia soli]|uniref:hypothetical protein n=1 Tax=Stackebrandtia soli TaxID=1892856 RepID=UPI0039E7A7A4
MPRSDYYLALFRMLGDERVGWDVVSLAGRGIAVEASSNVWMLNVGKRSVDPYRLGALLIAFGVTAERIPDLWKAFDDGVLSREDFVARLTETVEFLEAWPDIEPFSSCWGFVGVQRI